MKVLIMHDGLVFIDLTQGQLEKLEGLKVDSMVVKENAKGMKIKAEKAVLFDLLSELSYTYDIEII